ncbi:MAG: RlmE family RNA methyltransferase [Pseudomonadota bacterium]
MSKFSDEKSRAWFTRHVNDPFVQKAQKQGYRTRASYKLKEILDKERLLKPGMCVVDLGAAPGGWSQVAAEYVRPTGQVFALDLLPMDPISKVHVLKGDFLEESTISALNDALVGRQVDCVLCDISPDLTGIRDSDQARALELSEAVLFWTLPRLNSKGVLIIKCFQGVGLEPFHQILKKHFKTVTYCKPEASRKGSREIYLLAKQPKLV